MKRTLTIALLCTLGCGVAQAEDVSRVIKTGEEFKCSPFPANPAITTFDSAVVTCKVLGNVASSSTKPPAIARGTKLVGTVQAGRVVWSNWTTPDGFEVHVGANAEPVLVSSLKSDGRSDLTVVVMHDIKNRQRTRSFNASEKTT